MTTPTQVRYPLRAALRTGLAGLIAVSIIGPLAWAIIMEELAEAGFTIPAAITSFMATALAAVVALAAIVTRIMAIPQVSDLMTRVLNFGPAPRSDIGPAPESDYDPKYDLEDPTPGELTIGENGPEFTAGDI